MNAAPLSRRLFALIYESLMIGSVTVLTALTVGMMHTFIIQQVKLPNHLVSLVYAVALLAAWWFYFKINWWREQQTLPMRVWRIRLESVSGSRATMRQLRLRFMWACVCLVFLPMLVYAGLRYYLIAPRLAMGLALLWWLLPWGFAWLNPNRQFLYDYLAGTQLVDTRSGSLKKESA